MDGPRKLLLTMMLATVGLSLSAQATTDIYIAQNAHRGNTGAHCADPDSAAWFSKFQVPDLTTTVGKNDRLKQYFKGSAYTATWYVGLVDNASCTAYAVADTMASHGGGIETNTTYSQGTHPASTDGTVAVGSVDNSGSVAVFSTGTTTTVRGAFLNSVSIKRGSSGTLYGAADFGAARSLLMILDSRLSFTRETTK